MTYYKIKKANIEKASFGSNDILISMVWKYEDNHKWIKWVKLNDELIQDFLKSNIIIPDEKNRLF
jgi:hypothetical protein